MREFLFRPQLQFGLSVLAVAVCAGVLITFNPGTSGLYPPCPVHYLTGLHCPGCGTLRSLHALLHGQFIRAVSLNGLMVTSLPFVAYMAWVEPWVGPSWRLSYRPMVPWITLLVVGLYAILRNLPWYPFTLLSPH